MSNLPVNWLDLNLRAWLGVEEGGMVGDVVVFVLCHLWQGIVGLEDGQGFAEVLQCFGLEQIEGV